MIIVPASSLIIPVEIQIRELDSKLLLACVAAERGFPVILGSRHYIQFVAHKIERGFYLAKGGGPEQRMFEILRQLGHQIVAFDVDALVRVPDHEYYRMRMTDNAISQVSQILAWGPDDAQMFRGFPDYPGTPIHVVGNPRIDLTRPDLRAYYDAEVDVLRERYGDFVQINTNWAGINNVMPSHSKERIAAELEGPAPEGQYFKDHSTHRLALFESFVELVPAISKAFPEVNFVVRPHPLENHEAWIKAASSCPNVHVTNEGNILPWLLAARATISNGCTSTVESYLAGTPSLGYYPVSDELHDLELPKAVSRCCFDQASLFEALADVVEGRFVAGDDEATATQVAKHVVARDGRLSSDRIVDVFESAGYLERRPPSTAWKARLKGHLKNRKRTARTRERMALPDSEHKKILHDHRFPEISAAEIQSRVDRFRATTGRFEHVVVEPHSEHVFRIRVR